MPGVTLVTGASGFIGRYVVQQLLARGRSVRVLVRRPEVLPDTARRAVEVVAGDVRDPAALARAVRGAHTVLHLAACAKAWSRDPQEFVAVNVRAVGNLLQLAEAEGVERLVHVSTILTLPPHRPAPVNGRSQDPTPYESSKRIGERLVEAYAASGCHATIVHPTRVYGPGPLHDANGVTRAIALYLRGRLRLRLADGDALGSYVHAEDVAAGAIQAAEQGRPGAHYVLGGENASFRAVLDMVATLAGVRRGVVALPPGLGLAVARLTELWGRLGGDFVLPPGWVRVLLEDRRAAIEPVRWELGYRPRSLQDGLRQTIAWLAAERLIPTRCVSPA